MGASAVAVDMNAKYMTRRSYSSLSRVYRYEERTARDEWIRCRKFFNLVPPRPAGTEWVKSTAAYRSRVTCVSPNNTALAYYSCCGNTLCWN